MAIAKKWFTPGTVEHDGKQVPAQIWDPATRSLVPLEGKWVANSGHWHRVVAEGDGELSDTAPAGHADEE